MEKIKLTQEQANAIEYALNKTGDYKDDKDRLIRDISRDYVNFHNDLFSLNKIDIAVAAKALYAGYEVIPQYKVGDWITVFYENGNFKYTAKITSVESEFVRVDVNTSRNFPQYLNGYGIVRHATPEEIQQEKKRRFWNGIGRIEDEYKQNDLVEVDYQDYGIINGKTNSGTWMIYHINDDATVFCSSDEIRLIVKAEDRLDK
ncbi:hypothetical protein [Oceanobacillus sojae]|uniref:Uncharacterized protein n=1 Tax=Oceanobacillus sojae TaxID=582851 RepID=A0A511ZIF8_9BACI|nr:hypothetical protein [Oceanobacillus sojae]GEN87215.1 hypothetical protein OSO01_19540 [Oceanobacillus sojae]